MSQSPSSSSSGSSAIDNSGSGIVINKPNYVAWIVAGVVGLFLIVFWFNGKGRK